MESKTRRILFLVVMLIISFLFFYFVYLRNLTIERIDGSVFSATMITLITMIFIFVGIFTIFCGIVFTLIAYFQLDSEIIGLKYYLAWKFNSRLNSLNYLDWKFNSRLNSLNYFPKLKRKWKSIITNSSSCFW